MRIRAGFEIALRCERPTPLSGLLSVHPSRVGDMHAPNELSFDREMRWTTSRDVFGNITSRMLVPEGVLTLRHDFEIEDTGELDARSADAREVPVEELPDEAMHFLTGSRYCETDKLSALAWSLFGDMKAGGERVDAIIDYVHDRIRFGYEYASTTRSAWEAHQERRGVCRDFVHLAVAFCRCMNIPARYCSGYLGDIGVPATDIPMDFTAWMEVYLSGRWYTYDPRHAARRIGRILMARGRDAADVTIYTTFGPSELTYFRVFAGESPSS